jgi:hypothetical protein
MSWMYLLTYSYLRQPVQLMATKQDNFRIVRSGTLERVEKFRASYLIYKCLYICLGVLMVQVQYTGLKFFRYIPSGPKARIRSAGPIAVDW